MIRASLALLASAGLLAACATPMSATPDSAELERLTQQVSSRERAFSATMAARDFAAFQTFLAADATFRGANGAVKTDRAAVAAEWKRYFEGPQAPFSWAPDAVTVAADGRLAISTGPVRAPTGQTVARFTSVWRLEPDGQWRIVLDQGVPACDCPPK